MKNKRRLISILILILVLFLTGLVIRGIYHFVKSGARGGPAGLVKEIFICPMHPEFVSDKPGSCPICGMNLVKKARKEAPAQKQEKKLLYYRNPMDPQITSPVPMKDSMGMDYVPVYADQGTGQQSGVYINPQMQALIGVTKEKAQKRHLTYQILASGEIAYDPDLYVAQEEYLQALDIVNSTKSSVLPAISRQSNSLLEAAQKKLVLLGMNKTEIEELAKSGLAQSNLYLPQDADSIWAYMNIYEYESGLVKEDMAVEATALAYPGEVFKGKIISITPIVNAQTRSIQVRAQIDDPGHKLKPNMFINSKITVELGEKLSIPESAVIDTGERKIVYVVSADDNFEQRQVSLGQRAQGYFEVLSGVNEGDTVVSSGNFLVDSESKLRGAGQPQTQDAK